MSPEVEAGGEGNFERAGWRGIGVEADTVDWGKGFVALGHDCDHGALAVSVWVPNGPGHRRALGFWIPAEQAAAFGAAISEAASASPPSKAP